MRKILVLLVFLFLLPFSTLAVPNPGHSASQIGAGTFAEEGNYVFPNASKVGINITTPIAALDIRSYSTRGLFVVGSGYPITGTSIDGNATGYLGYSSGSSRIGVLGLGNTAGGYFSNPSGTSAYLAASSYGLDVTGDVRWSGTLQGGSVPWARLTSFPSACPAGQYVTAVGSTLTCSAPPAGGNISGSGAATRVAFFTGANTISSDSNLYWDNTNKRLGIGTTTPTGQLTVKGSGSTNTYLDIIANPADTSTDSWVGQLRFFNSAGTLLHIIRAGSPNAPLTITPGYNGNAPKKLKVDGDTEITDNLNVGGYVKIGGAKLTYVSGNNPSCPSGSAILMKKIEGTYTYSGTTCYGETCYGCGCSVSQWTTKDSLSCCCVGQSCGGYLVGCVSRTYCSGDFTTYTEALCVGN